MRRPRSAPWFVDNIDMPCFLIARRPTPLASCKGRLLRRVPTPTLMLMPVLMLLVLTAGPLRAACTVGTAGMSFGTYHPLTLPGKLSSADALSTCTISVTCSAGITLTSYTLALGASTAGTGDRISTRFMANSNGGDNMVFNLYTDSNRTVVWGNGATGTTLSGSLSIVGLGSQTQSVTVYGKVPSGQNTLRAGDFSGAMTLTLTYNP